MRTVMRGSDEQSKTKCLDLEFKILVVLFCMFCFKLGVGVFQDPALGLAKDLQVRPRVDLVLALNLELKV